MADVGWATLDIIPSLKGLQAELDRQTRGPLAAAGRTGGKVFGDAAAQGAGTSFVPRFQNGAKTLEVAGRTGGRVYGQTAGKEAGSSFTDLFQRETKTFGTAGISGGKAFGTSAGREAAGGFVSLFRRQVQAPIIVAGQAGGQAYGAAAGDQAGSSFAETFQNGLQGSDLIAGAGIADIFQDSIADVGDVGQQAGEEFSDGAADGLGKLQGLLAGAGVVGIFKDLVDQASAAEQSVGGVEAVFGEYAESIKANSAQAAQSLGLSSTAYQELVTVSGAFLKNKGLSDYAVQADLLVQKGADLAAQYGGPTTDAVGALTAALRGESDPIERYAIGLNEAAINARLAANGQASLTGKALDQAKIMARLAIIQEQSVDATGAFGRELNTQANQTQIAKAKLVDLRTELGANLLPAATAVTTVFNKDVIPALSNAGGVAVDAGRAFVGLPDPIKTAALAFVALRVASSLGLASLATNAIAAAGSAFISLRLRIMFAGDAFTATRAKAGLFQAGLAGLQAGAVGTGAALGSLALSLAPVIAITAAISLYSKYKQEQQKVKDRVDALTQSLDQQTGAITKNTAQALFDNLDDDGAIDAAKELGINLNVLRDAVLGNADALDKLRPIIFVAQKSNDELTGSALKAAEARSVLNDALFSEQDALKESKEQFRDQAAFTQDAADATGEMSGATKTATGALDDYITNVDRARSAVRQLVSAEKEQYDARLKNRTDALALEQQIANARKEAREGKDGLNIRTIAGRDNRGALYDLAEQFNNSSPKVRNAEGAYERIRGEFMKLADQMGAGEGQAKKLADQLLRVPQLAPLRFQTPGLQEAIRDQREFNRELERFLQLAQQNSYARLNNGAPGDLAGLVPGRGGQAPVSVPARPRRRDRGESQEESGRTISTGPTYQYNGPVTYTDDEQGRRRAQRMERRAGGDGVRRP